MGWRLERTVQCAHCPWRKDVVASRDIPNGYDVEKHKKLKGTIARGDGTDWHQALTSPEMRLMCCHEEHDQPCIGWLWNQLGPGNNIALRMRIRSCENFRDVRVIGEQHERFEDTIT